MKFIHGEIDAGFSGLEILLAFLVLLVFVMHVVLIGRRNRRVRKDRLLLEEQRRESRELLDHRDQLLHHRNRLILHRNKLQNRNKEYVESLRYAQRIQKAMFITPEKLRKLFPESFIYQRPKEIVSGDFTWARQVNGQVLFSVADCTGHGVPGAFMSLLGLEFIRQIISKGDPLSPAGILNTMNEYFDVVFGERVELELKDGIDLAICAYDYRNKILRFAGAFNPVYLVRDQEIMEFKGSRITVGPDNGMQRGQFENQSMEIVDGDIIYLFTDGYADQFGGPEGKKFKYRRFRHLLRSIHQLPMDEQENRLEENMAKWMGNGEVQIDDQTVIGIRPASFPFS